MVVESPNSLVALLAGSTAGFCVDLTLFPIDTIKTRIQSAQRGIHRASGSLRLFAGLPAVVLGSAPGAAIFFVSYESTKLACSNIGFSRTSSNVFAACVAEIAACIIRVPCEVVKQRTQNQPNRSVSSIFLQTLRSEGIRGFYRGYLSTVSREIPFSFIQFPLWEQLKLWSIQWNQKRNHGTSTQLHPWQSLLCGSIAGSVAGALTTPLDVAKTRIMLAQKNTTLASGNILHALTIIFNERGVQGLFAGLLPRVAFLSVGGAIFLGVYDLASLFWTRLV